MNGILASVQPKNQQLRFLQFLIFSFYHESVLKTRLNSILRSCHSFAKALRI